MLLYVTVTVILYIVGVVIAGFVAMDISDNLNSPWPDEQERCY